VSNQVSHPYTTTGKTVVLYILTLIFLDIKLEGKRSRWCTKSWKSVVTSKGWYKRLRWSRGSVLAFSTQVRGFKPGRSLRIFKGEKTPSFGGEVKPSVPCRRFAACKRSLYETWKSHLGKITGHDSRPRSSTFRC
jgi:hypothetical protein